LSLGREQDKEEERRKEGGTLFPFLALFLPQNSPSCANFTHWFGVGGLQLGEKWLVPPTQPYPHHRQKKGLMIAVSLTFLCCLIRVMEGRAQKPLQVNAPCKSTG